MREERPADDSDVSGGAGDAAPVPREGIDRGAQGASPRRYRGADRAVPPGPIDLVNGDHYLGSSTTPAAVAGYPSITVPAGDVSGLPIG